MSRLFLVVLAAVVAASLQTSAAQPSAVEAEKLLARAQHKATIDGDLKGAIEDYKEAVAAAGNNRALAAQALLRMAECHQKLGDAQARAIYERLVRDYADQQDVAVIARMRVATTSAVTPTRGDRSVWTGQDADGFGTISPDGRFLTYTDWANGAALALRDLRTGTNYHLTSSGSTQFSAISKDGKLVAYEWMDNTVPADARRYELRVARLHATGMSEARRVFDSEEVAGVAPYDWSPDGRWIAVNVTRRDRTLQIGLISVADGQLRVLKSLDWRQTIKIFFSPDGTHIGYDAMASDSSDESHVFVMAVDGSREVAAVAHPSHNVMMGWSPDGAQLLFASDRSGSIGLWSLPMEGGRPEGPAILLKPDIASSWSLGLTPAGTMYVWKYASPGYVQASAIDLASGKLVPGPATFQRFITSRGRPDWSADGKYLAYQSCGTIGGGACTLWIRSMDTGQLREVKVRLRYFFFPRWSPDGRELIVRGIDQQGRNNGLYRIDVQTGETTLVVTPYPGRTMPQWGADSKHVYYRRDSSLIERDLATGNEREAVHIPAAGPAEAVSPDGQHVAYSAAEPKGTSQLFVLPLAGGTPRTVFRMGTPERVIRFDWTQDGRALVVATRNDDSRAQTLWLVDPAGGSSRRLAIDISNWRVEDGFRLDRAGKQIAFVAAAGQPGLEIRALENFLPARAGTK